MLLHEASPVPISLSFVMAGSSGALFADCMAGRLGVNGSKACGAGGGLHSDLHTVMHSLLSDVSWRMPRLAQSWWIKARPAGLNPRSLSDYNNNYYYYYHHHYTGDFNFLILF